MEQYEKIRGYQQRQVWLQQQIRLLKAGKRRCGDEPTTMACIRSAERQVGDLDRTIARLRKTGRGPATTALLLCGLLAGCGTNVQWLLAEQGRLTHEADRLATAAEDLGSGMEQPVYDAEDRQLAACGFLTDAVADGLEQKPSFGKQFVSDLSAVLVLLVPVEPVETCADSVDAYRASIAQLEDELTRSGAPVGTRR